VHWVSSVYTAHVKAVTEAGGADAARDIPTFESLLRSYSTHQQKVNKDFQHQDINSDEVIAVQLSVGNGQFACSALGLGIHERVLILTCCSLTDSCVSSVSAVACQL
jgi:hypothetical protein